MKAVLIIDDHEIVRMGLKLLISEMYAGSQVDEAPDGERAIPLLKKKTYDLIILDIQLPETNSLELLQYISNSPRGARVLVFSMNSETLYGKRVMQAGAFGYLSKQASMAEVKKALAMVLDGRKYVSEKLMEVFVGEVVNEAAPNPFAQLSSREFEITGFLLKGLSISVIADQVHLEASTVATYKARIFDKLKVNNLLELKELAVLFHFL